MRFKTKFKDYVPEEEFLDVHSWGFDDLLDEVWQRIIERYPENGDQWDKIYEKVKDDILLNYDIEVNVYIREKKLGGENE